MADPDAIPTTLAGLLASRKGRLDYVDGDAFLLHVFWEAPSAAAAHKLLEGLRQCAAATYRDTPCVPTYVFRIHNGDGEVCAPAPRTVRDHPHLRAAIKKLEVGISPNAVRAELVKRGFDPALIELGLDAELPASFQVPSVAVEFTEIYLDERAFVQHAGSRDYLDGYAVVTDPAMHYRTPHTIRLGTPPGSIVERILEPMLHEEVAELAPGCTVWSRPAAAGPLAPVLFSVDVARKGEGETATPPAAVAAAAAVPLAFRDHCTTFVAFAHPLRERTTRLFCVLHTLPATPVLAALAAALGDGLVRGEAHVTAPGGAGPAAPEAVEAVRRALAEAGLAPLVTVNASECVGYVLHDRAPDLYVVGRGGAPAAPGAPVSSE